MASKLRWVLPLVVASQMGATDCGSVIRDDGFDLWCGDELCAWKLERGEIERVATWHEGDSGVSFVGGDVAIEQLSPVNNTDGTCMTFSMVANVETNAEVYLNIDIQGDGSVERSERIPTSNWQPLTYAIHFAAPFDGVRFELAKTGDGEAVLAQLKGIIDNGACSGLPTIGSKPRADGAACDLDTECMSAKCRHVFFPSTSETGNFCVGCDGTTCGGAMVCGAGEPTSPVLAIPLECQPLADKVLGETCYANEECASGFCVGQACSACDPNDNAGKCGDGRACAPAWVTPFGVFATYVCGPGLGTSASGEGCGTDADCASGHCNGTVREQCDDGRACATSVTCPPKANLEPGPCNTVGIQGGSCQ